MGCCPPGPICVGGETQAHRGEGICPGSRHPKLSTHWSSSLPCHRSQGPWGRWAGGGRGFWDARGRWGSRGSLGQVMGPPSKACRHSPQVTSCEAGSVAAEAELVLLQLSVHLGREEGGLSARPGGSERRSKLPEAAQQWRTERLADPELGLVPSFWWSGRWPQPPTHVAWLQPSVRVRVCAVCRRAVCWQTMSAGGGWAQAPDFWCVLGRGLQNVK